MGNAWVNNRHSKTNNSIGDRHSIFIEKSIMEKVLRAISIESRNEEDII